MIGPRHVHARLQGDFYRDQYRKILRWLLILVVIMFMLIAGIIYFVLVQPSRAYYGNTTEGKILLMPGIKSGG